MTRLYIWKSIRVCRSAVVIKVGRVLRCISNMWCTILEPVSTQLDFGCASEICFEKHREAASSREEIFVSFSSWKQQYLVSFQLPNWFCISSTTHSAWCQKREAFAAAEAQTAKLLGFSCSCNATSAAHTVFRRIVSGTQTMSSSSEDCGPVSQIHFQRELAADFPTHPNSTKDELFKLSFTKEIFLLFQIQGSECIFDIQQSPPSCYLPFYPRRCAEVFIHSVQQKICKCVLLESKVSKVPSLSPWSAKKVKNEQSLPTGCCCMVWKWMVACSSFLTTFERKYLFIFTIFQKPCTCLQRLTQGWSLSKNHDDNSVLSQC